MQGQDEFDWLVRQEFDKLVAAGVLPRPPPPRRNPVIIPPQTADRVPAWRSRRPDALDTDSEGTVTKAWGIYLRCRGRDPMDETGLVARAREIALIIRHEAEKRRLAKDAADTKAKWDKILEAKHGRAYQIATDVWYGFPFAGAREMLYPELPDEVALTRGEWLDYVVNHKLAGAKSMLDHLGSILPPRPGETYEQWRERLKRRRDSWRNDTDEAVVNRSLSARPPLAGPRSLATSQSDARTKARRRRARPSA